MKLFTRNMLLPKLLKEQEMALSKLPVWMKLKLVRGTMVWAQEHLRGRGDLIYEVVAIVGDGTSMDRISLRAIGESRLAFVGITPDLFEAACNEPLPMVRSAD